MITEVLKAVFIATVALVLFYEMRTHALHRRYGTLTPLLHRRFLNRLLGLGFLSLSVLFLAAPGVFVFMDWGPLMHLLSYGMAFVCILIVLVFALRDLVLTGQIAKVEEEQVLWETVREVKEKIRAGEERSGEEKLSAMFEHPYPFLKEIAPKKKRKSRKR